MQKNGLSKILIEYEQECDLYEDLRKKVHALVEELLHSKDLRVHSITSRIKEKDSLKQKIFKPESHYKNLTEITDLCGIRIITYFPDEVDAIASIIKKEFNIDPKNSVDKRALLDPDRFGYLSLHYIAKLTPSRLKLSEYKRFSKCQFEIQIRSILQHTWAEIEHDLGYKSKISVPRNLQRRFYQLAGLLELADSEFSDLRDKINKYERSLQKTILHPNKSISIDKESITAYVSHSQIVKRIDENIAKECNIYIKGIDNSDMVINRLYWSGFSTFTEIEEFLKQNEALVLHFAKTIIGHYEKKQGGWHYGVSLFFLCYAKITITKSLDKVYKFSKLAAKGSTMKEKEIKEFAERLLRIYYKALP